MTDTFRDLIADSLDLDHCTRCCYCGDECWLQDGGGYTSIGYACVDCCNDSDKIALEVRARRGEA